MVRAAWIMLWACALGLLLSGGAWARRGPKISLLTPKSMDAGAADAAAELGLALERALRRGDKGTLVGRPLSPDELLAAFGCFEVDAACAQQVGQTAKAQQVLMSTVRTSAHRFDVEVVLVTVATGQEALRERWRVQGGEDPAHRDEVLSASMAAVAHWVLSGGSTRAAALLPLIPDRGPVQLDGRPVPTGQVVSLPSGRHEIDVPGRPLIEVDLLPGEITVVDLPVALGEVSKPAGGLSNRRLGAWVTLGLGVAAGLGAGWAASEMGQTQDDFDAANDRATLEDLAARGNNLEMTANGLMVLTVLSLGTSTWLFLDN